jgi:hypothetical protein
MHGMNEFYVKVFGILRVYENLSSVIAIVKYMFLFYQVHLLSFDFARKQNTFCYVKY